MKERRGGAGALRDVCLPPRASAAISVPVRQDAPAYSFLAASTILSTLASLRPLMLTSTCRHDAASGMHSVRT